MANRFSGKCPCGRYVQALAGDVTKVNGAWVVHCANHNTRGEKQTIVDGKFVWVQDHLPAEPPAVKTEISNIQPVISLLEKAGERLKYPAMVFTANGADYRLSVAGPRASVPGSINVCTAERSYQDREWFGRIHPNGTFEASRRVEAGTATAVAAALAAIAADPAGVAADYGKRTGCCCFCEKELTDERSAFVGYGATCAKNFGLPYPTKTQVRSANQKTLFDKMAA